MPAIPARIEKVNSIWVYQAPFFAEFLSNFSFSETSDISTIGIGILNRRFIVRYNASFIDKLSDNDLCGVLIHEIMHLIYLSHKRLGSRNPMIFNMAADIPINNTILDSCTIGGVQVLLPQNGLFLANIIDMGYTGPCIAESIYDWMEKQTSNGTPIGEPMDDHSGLQEISDAIENDSLVALAIRNMIDNAKARGYGSLSANYISSITNLLKTPEIPIEAVILKSLSQHISGYGKKHSTWKKENRRELPLKGYHRKRSDIKLVVDTSGSCFSQETIGMFFNTIDQLSLRYHIDVIEFDTEVKSETQYKSGNWKSFVLHGGGSTDIQPAFDYLHNKRYDHLPLVILTDGEFSHDIEYHDFKPLWVIIKNNSYSFHVGKL